MLSFPRCPDHSKSNGLCFLTDAAIEPLPDLFASRFCAKLRDSDTIAFPVLSRIASGRQKVVKNANENNETR